jgi:hypothetical protein
LGEHASIASFGAFTIALLSNGAPPDLVSDALTAGLDEVRHAKVSFEIASMLLGGGNGTVIVEPGPLPASSLNFGNNLTALALGATQEGCVEETLSALVAFMEVEEELDQEPNIGTKIKELLKDKMTTIAMEEASHSALAWRTVQWVCNKDSIVCDPVAHQVLSADRLQRAFQRRFHHSSACAVEKAERQCSRVLSTLIPAVLQGGLVTGFPAAPIVDDCNPGEEDTMQRSLLQRVTDKILREVMCSSTCPVGLWRHSFACGRGNSTL